MWATCNSYIVIRSSSTFQFLHGIIICFHVHIHADRDSEQSSSRWTTDVPCCWTLVVSSSFYFVRPEMLVTGTTSSLTRITVPIILACSLPTSLAFVTLQYAVSVLVSYHNSQNNVERMENHDREH